MFTKLIEPLTVLLTGNIPNLAQVWL